MDAPSTIDEVVRGIDGAGDGAPGEIYGRIQEVLDLVTTGLSEIGYRFVARAPVRATADELAVVDELRGKGIELPAAVVEFWCRIGEVDLIGDFPGGPVRIRRSPDVPRWTEAKADPLVVYGPKEGTWDLTGQLMSGRPQGDEALSVELSPDFITKVDYGGGNPYDIQIIDPNDYVRFVPWGGPNLTFGRYLVHALLAAGLPGLKPDEAEAVPGLVPLRARVRARLVS